MSADDPKELLEQISSVRDKIAAEAAELMRRWEPLLKRGDFQKSGQTSPVTWCCGTSTCGRCRLRSRPGALLRSDDARAG